LKYWDSIYLWDNSATAYVDLEFAAADEPGTTLPLLGQPADKVYMGLDRTFNCVYFQLGTIGSGLGTFTYEYWDGSIWRNMPLKRTYSFNETGVGEFPIPINWTARTLTASPAVESTVNGVASEDVAYYWLRISQTATPTIVCLAFPAYAV